MRPHLDCVGNVNISSFKDKELAGVLLNRFLVIITEDFYTAKDPVMTFLLLKHENLKTVVIGLGRDLDCVETIELVHLAEYFLDHVRLPELYLNAGLSVDNVWTALH